MKRGSALEAADLQEGSRAGKPRQIPQVRQPGNVKAGIPARLLDGALEFRIEKDVDVFGFDDRVQQLLAKAF
jgi:hypothetical protein